MHYSWKYICTIVTMSLCIGVNSPVFAVCGSTCAVTEIDKLSFSTLQKPAAGSVTYTVPPDGSATSGSATVLYGTALRGQYNAVRTSSVSGCTGTTYDVQNVSTGNAGVSLGTWQGYINSATQSLPYTTSGVYPALVTGNRFYIGATATVTSSATSGSFSPSYDIVCTIQ
jgi:hypothetical protein